jgi:hypothetical protein
MAGILVLTDACDLCRQASEASNSILYFPIETGDISIDPYTQNETQTIIEQPIKALLLRENQKSSQADFIGADINSYPVRGFIYEIPSGIFSGRTKADLFFGDRSKASGYLTFSVQIHPPGWELPAGQIAIVGTFETIGGGS